MPLSHLQHVIPTEQAGYQAASLYVVTALRKIFENAVVSQRNKIQINTNLHLGLPMENINKIAGPFVEAWAAEVLYNVASDPCNVYGLVEVETRERLYMADVILHFNVNGVLIVAEVDVKATAADIFNSGKGPNITSFSRIRTAYVRNPNYIFIILSLKHKVYSQRNAATGLMDGVMEVVGYNAYDLKYLSAKDVNFNPALGSGQIQVRDIHQIQHQYRSTWDFCQLLDQKYLGSSRRTVNNWIELARSNKWIQDE